MLCTHVYTIYKNQSYTIFPHEKNREHILAIFFKTTTTITTKIYSNQCPDQKINTHKTKTNI